MREEKPDPAPWTLLRGASWLCADGTVYRIPGFHDAWIAAHRELVGACANACEVVLATRWIGVSAYEGGYVELLITGSGDGEVLERARRFLELNAGLWKTVLVLTMDEEGYVRLEQGDEADAEAFVAKFRARAPVSA